MSQLHDLSKPFPSKFIHGNPSGGGSYVKHHVVDQRLLQVVGPFDWEKVEIIRGFVPGKAPNPNGTSARAKAGTPDLADAVVGVIWRLTVEIDGRRIVIEEAGDCEEPNNWPHDGARLKDALSDALKRCAMRFGCGLHLWSQDEYFLFSRLGEEGATPPPNVDPTTGEISGGGEPASPPPAAPPVSQSTPTEAAKADQEVAAKEPPDERGAATPPTTNHIEQDRGRASSPAPTITAAQMRMMQALFAKHDPPIKADTEKRDYATSVVGREVTSLTTLTVGEANKVIDALQMAKVNA